MTKILPVALVMGLIAGLLVGGFHNVFTVPVLEWAIGLEEAAAEAEAAATGVAIEEGGGIVISLGVQRIGLVGGLVVLGVLFGAIYTALYHLVRKATPGWNIWTWSLIAGFLGFWFFSLLGQMKFPLNPPGVGEEASLLSRQLFQFLFIIISFLAVVGASIAIKAINQSDSSGMQRFLRYAGLGTAYLVAVVLMFLVIPGNPDPTPDWVPEALVIMFRTFTIIGQFLVWMTISLGVAGYIKYNDSGIKASEPADNRVSVG